MERACLRPAAGVEGKPHLNSLQQTLLICNFDIYLSEVVRNFNVAAIP